MRRDDLQYMTQTQRLIEAAGTRYPNAYASLSQCCPSRATILSGRYAHNTGVLTNVPPHGGYEAFRGQETIGQWLQATGYQTAYIGKYLNGYGQPELGSPATEVVAGWDSWQAFANHTAYHMFDYQLNVDGELVSYGGLDSQYQTDVLAKRASDLITQWAPAADPFFIALAPLAPHRESEGLVGKGAEILNPRPAPRDRYLADEMVFRPEHSPAFNEVDRSDKPQVVQDTVPHSPHSFRRTYRGHVTSSSPSTPRWRESSRPCAGPASSTTR